MTLHSCFPLGDMENGYMENGWPSLFKAHRLVEILCAQVVGPFCDEFRCVAERMTTAESPVSAVGLDQVEESVGAHGNASASRAGGARRSF